MKLTYIACLGTAAVLGVVLFAAKSANSDSPAASNASPPAQPAAPVPQTQVFFMPPEGMKFVNYREGNEVLQRARTALAEGDPKAALVLIEEAERKHATAGHVLAERARAYRAIGDDAKELEVLNNILFPLQGPGGSNLWRTAATASRILELSERTGTPITDRFDPEIVRIRRPGRGAQRTLADYEADGWNREHALMLDRIYVASLEERHEEALTLADELVEATQRSEAYFDRAVVRARIPKAPTEMPAASRQYFADVRQAYARGGPAFQAEIQDRYFPNVWKDWPQTAEELEHP